MFSDLNQRLLEITESRRQQRKLQGHLAEAQRSLEQERTRLAELEHSLQKEGQDVEKLEGLSLNGLFYTVLGSKEEQLEKERQEYLAARLKYEKSRYPVSALEQEVAGLQQQLARLGDVEAQYQAVMAQKETLLRQSGDERGKRLLTLADELAQAQVENRELLEAIAAGKTAQQGLGEMIDALGSASNWGMWDMLGGGLIATAAKHSRIDEAREAAHHVQQQLRRFQRELADVNSQTGQLLVDVSSFETFADFFLDGLIFDWVVQSRINQSLVRVQKLHHQIGKILMDLTSKQAAAEIRVNSLKEEKQALVEQAK